MSSIFAPDSEVQRTLALIADAVWINILFVVTSIPIVTIGASLTAAYTAARKSLAAEGHVTRNFFKAFKENWGKASLIWLVEGPLIVIFIASWIFLKYSPLFVLQIALGVLLFISNSWVWALQARFDNTVGGTLKNSFIFGISKIGTTFSLLIIDAAFIGLAALTYVYMSWGVYFFLIFGFGALIMFHVPLIEHAMKKYLAPTPADK
jgi:uncharacterized membrane protein YesL